jgi:hypothetical protein
MNFRSLAQPFAGRIARDSNGTRDGTPGSAPSQITHIDMQRRMLETPTVQPPVTMRPVPALVSRRDNSLNPYYTRAANWQTWEDGTGAPVRLITRFWRNGNLALAGLKQRGHQDGYAGLDGTLRLPPVAIPKTTSMPSRTIGASSATSNMGNDTGYVPGIYIGAN